jgi:hypothetical protein
LLVCTACICTGICVNVEVINPTNLEEEEEEEEIKRRKI